MDDRILDEMRPFFYPDSVAVVGVSQDPTKPGSCLLKAMRNAGFKGKIFPVGQRITEFDGLTVYPSIASVPGTLDLVRICVPANFVPSVLTECKNKGVRAVEIITSGFKETGTEEGKKLEAAVSGLAGEGMHVIGPNCFGVYCPESGVTHIPGDNYPREHGKVGFISQSGGISEDICRSATESGFRLSKVVSYGNAAEIDETDLLNYMEADPETEIVGIYIEGVRHGRDFYNSLRRLSQKKPVIIWKGGLSPEGARAAASHTASLAGNEKIWETIFRQTNAIKAGGLEELLDIISIFNILKPLSDNRVSVICSGGGNSVAATDISFEEGLFIPKFDDELRQKIASRLPPVGASAANPVDVGPPFFPPAEILRDMLETIAVSRGFGSIVIDKLVISKRMREILDYTGQMSWEDQPWLEEVPVTIVKNHDIAMLLVIREGGDKPGNLKAEEERRRLRDYYQRHGIPVYPTLKRALRALGKFVSYHKKNRSVNPAGSR